MEVPKPLKYFEVYTKQIEEDAKAGISKSSSKLHLVPKDGKKHSSRQPRRLRDKGSLKRTSNDANTNADVRIPTSSSSKTPLTAETLAQHTAMLPTGDNISPPLAKMHEPVRVPLPAEAGAPTGKNPLHVDQDHCKKEQPAFPSRLAVPSPLDIFAGPSSPVSAESLTNLAVSATQMDIHLSNLPSNDSCQSLPADIYAARGGLAESAFTATDDARTSSSGVREATLPRSASISETTARFFQRTKGTSQEPIRQAASTIPSIDDIIKQHHILDVLPRVSGSMSSPPVPSIPAKFRSEKQQILTIEEIIQRNAQIQAPFRKMGHSAAPDFADMRRPARSRTFTEDTDSSKARSSIDSVTGEIMQSIKHQTHSHPLKPLNHARSQPSLSTPSAAIHRERKTSVLSSSPSLSRDQCSPLLSSRNTSPRAAPTSDEEITQYIRSRRLTRLLTLRRPPNHHLLCR
ncbi:hypothetical protein P389DRAFT_209601, partial [Cystobasidium minutum MCA 4210]|uniref:uncharacterized protein n=1 Tax=Cystobasidium minutum MCA 4210 TaxID=1397322 RepID=UPI0034CEB98B|eukprot:jgi/Rhomi1/209601/estExt_Genemark1.C_3_t10227